MPHPEKDETNDARKKKAATRKRWTWLVRLTALAALVLFLLPHGIRWGAQRWLDDHGAVETHIENVDFNPFTGRLAFFGVAVHGADSDRLSCERFGVNLDWLPLIKKRLHLATLQVEGLHFDARRLEDGQWLLGGISLPSTEKKESDWQWGIGDTHLRNLVVDLRTDRMEELFTLNQFRMTNLYSWNAGDATPFRLEMTALGGEWLFNGRGRPFSTPSSVDATLQIDGISLRKLEPLVETSIGGSLTLDAAILAEKGNEPESLRVKADGKTSVAGFTIGVADLHLGSDILDFSGALRFAGGSEKQWSVDGDLEAEAVTVDDPDRGLNMVRVEGFSLQGAHVEAGDAMIEQALLSGIGAFERPGDAGGRSADTKDTDPLEQSAHLLKAREVALGAMRFNEEVIRFEKVILDGGEILLLRRPEKGMEVSVWIDGDEDVAAESGKAKGDAEEVGEENARGPHLQIDDLQVNESRLLFVDREISPTFRLDARPLKLRIENLDRSAPNEDISVVVDSKINDYATLHLEGRARPFGDALDVNFTGTIDSFDLASLSPYAARHLDYRLKQGHLDVSLDWRIEDWQLAADNDLKISKLRVESLKEDQKTRLTELLGLRASTALSLLRDRQDNIEIELPLKGDLRDPEFEFDRVIVKAVRQSVQKTAVFYYAPMGLTLLTGIPFPPGSLTIADRVIDWMTSVQFDPVPFEPGSSELNEEARAYIGTMAATLKEKEKLRIVICGRAVPVDLGGEGPPEKPWSEETRQELLDLAAKRARAVKEALVAAGIPADRLFLCQPQLQEGDQGEPRVDLYL